MGLTESVPLPVLTPSPNAVRGPRDPQAPSHVRTQLLNAATQLGLCLHAKLCSIFSGLLVSICFRDRLHRHQRFAPRAPLSPCWSRPPFSPPPARAIIPLPERPPARTARPNRARLRPPKCPRCRSAKPSPSTARLPPTIT